MLSVRHSTRLAVACLCAVSFVHTLSAAETVTLTDGKQVRGEFISMSPTEVVIKPTVGEARTINVNEISLMEWTGEPADMRLARNAEKAGRIDDALERYQLAAGSASNENFRTDLDFLISRANARLALTDPAKQEEAIKMMDSFITRNAQHFRYYEALSWLGDLYTAKKDVANAEATYAKLGQAPWPDFKMAAQINQGKLKLSQGDIDAAMTEFKAVSGMPANNPAQKSRKLEAMLGQTNCLVQKKNYTEALKVLDGVAKEADSKDTAIQAEVYLRKGDCHLANDETKAALLAYLHVDVLFFQEGELHAEALYHLSQLWGKVGKSNRGEDAARRLREDYKNSDWTKKLTAGAGS